MTTAPKFERQSSLALAVLGATLVLSCKVTDNGSNTSGGGSGGTGMTGDGSGGNAGSTNGSGGDNGSGGGDNGSGGGAAVDASAGEVSDPNSDPNEVPDGGGASAETIAQEQLVRMRLDAITSKIMGTHTLFINCTMSPCSARLDAPTLTVMRQLLLAVSADYMGRIDFTVRLHLDGFSGTTYQADVVLDSDKKRPVPDDENALLDAPN